MQTTRKERLKERQNKSSIKHNIHEVTKTCRRNQIHTITERKNKRGQTDKHKDRHVKPEIRKHEM